MEDKKIKTLGIVAGAAGVISCGLSFILSVIRLYKVVKLFRGNSVEISSEEEE